MPAGHRLTAVVQNLDEDWFDADGALPDYSTQLDHNNDGMNAFAHANTVWNWYASTFDHCSYDDDDAEVEIRPVISGGQAAVGSGS